MSTHSKCFYSYRFGDSLNLLNNIGFYPSLELFRKECSGYNFHKIINEFSNLFQSFTYSRLDEETSYSLVCLMKNLFLDYKFRGEIKNIPDDIILFEHRSGCVVVMIRKQ